MSNREKVQNTKGYRVVRAYLKYSEGWEPGDAIMGLINAVNAACVESRLDEAITARRIANEEGDYDTAERLELRIESLKRVERESAPDAPAQDDEIVVRID